MSNFLVTFHPLVRSAAGRLAASRHGLAPFIDGSCRREPDLESRYPSITATCRAGHLAPRLQPGDRIAYLTVKGKYLGDVTAGWRVVAVLHVLQRFASHEAAADWYRKQALPLPSNCLVPDNPPKPYYLTNQCWPCSDMKRTVPPSDAKYRNRVKRWPMFLSCEAEVVNVQAPPQILAAEMVAVFGRIPATCNPPKIEDQQLNHLLRIAGERAA